MQDAKLAKGRVRPAGYPERMLGIGERFLSSVEMTRSVSLHAWRLGAIYFLESFCRTL